MDDKEFVDSLLQLMSQIAPDRAEIEAIIRDRGVSIIPIDEESRTPFAVDVETAEIRAYLPVLARHQLQAYAYILMHRAAVEFWGREDYWQRLESDPRVLQATATLQHVMFEKMRLSIAISRNSTTFHRGSLPEGVRFPNLDDRNGYLAINYFEMAMAADLHHELGHITRSHKAGQTDEVAVEQELEADEEAARWLVGARTQEDQYYMARMLGLLLSQTFDMFLKLEGEDSDRQHPPLADRLRNALMYRPPSDNHAAWAFATTILSLHLILANRRIKFDHERPVISFRESFEYYLSVYEGVERR